MPPEFVPSSFTLRRATAADAPAIATLTRELGYPADLAAISSRLRAVTASPNDAVWVAVDSSDTPVGWLHAHSAQLIESGHRVEILGLIVSRTVRRTGLGRALVAEAERWAASLGAETIVVRSNLTREESHAFYPALGYETVKTQRVYRKGLSPVES